MTVVVAFLCTDGVVIGADSMLSVSMGNVPVAQHMAKKVHILQGNQIAGYAGNPGFAARFRALVDLNLRNLTADRHPLVYASLITKSAQQEFEATKINLGNLDLNTVLAFPHKDAFHCCAFESPALQPRLLDKDHFFVSFGTGAVATNPFLRFLYNVFCQGNQPPLREAIFLTTWALKYAIETIPGGVATPLYIGVLNQGADGQSIARELSDDDIREHEEAMNDARQALRDWRDSLHAPTADKDAPCKPEPPKSS